jgi:hypothetical protein
MVRLGRWVKMKKGDHIIAIAANLRIYWQINFNRKVYVLCLIMPD